MVQGCRALDGFPLKGSIKATISDRAFRAFRVLG